MGLIFALQVDPKNENPKVLHLKSHFRKFAMGGSMLFGGVFLGVMPLAADPLFKLMRTEGGFFDLLLVGFFYSVLIAYPILAAICFLFEENVFIKSLGDGRYSIDKYRSVLFVKWKKEKLDSFKLEDISEENWIGALNTAAIKDGQKTKYATKGHWLLVAKNKSSSLVLERRAKKEEIQWLKFLIEKHFKVS